MANVEFQDFRVQVEETIEDGVYAFLAAVAGEIEARTKRNSRQGKKYNGIQAHELWEYRVDEDNKIARVGSPHEAGFWEELGTGEYALNGDGRKGWWIYIDGDNGTSSGYQSNHYRSREEAEEMAAYIKEKYGKNAVVTNGQEPNRPLFRAFNGMNKSQIENIARSTIGRLDNE